MEDAVTLFVQGHGREDINDKFINDQSVELLSFVGKPGELGTMKLCKNYKNKPIDIVAIDFLHNQYKNHGNMMNDAQKEIFHFIGEELPDIYKNCGIQYTDGFTFTWPRLEREFIFEPGEHENCRLCNEPPENDVTTINTPSPKNSTINNCRSGRCLPERKKNMICCPEYGLSVVASSFSQDIPFTFTGSKNRIMSNINMYLPAKDYWKNRASSTYKYLVDQIYDEKYIHLTDLYLLFNSMGFKHIYIYDPTCRDCEIDNVTANQYRSLELTKPNNDTIIQQPTNSISVSTDPQKSNKSNNYFDDCINGVCNLFQKQKVNGGRSKKVFKNNKITKINKNKRNIKTKKRLKKIKTKRYLKKNKK